MSYETLCKLPMGVFWHLSKNIPRIQATEDKRLFAVFNAVMASGGADLFARLSKEHGDIITTELTNAGKKARFKKIKAFFGGDK